MAFLAILAFFASAQVKPVPALPEASLTPLDAVLLHVTHQLGAVVLVQELDTSRVDAKELIQRQLLSKAEAEVLGAPFAAPTPVDWFAICHPRRCRLIAPQELASILSKATHDDPDKGWNELDSRFGSSTVIILGAPVVAGDDAAVNWWQTRGLLNGRHVLSILRKRGGAWSVVKDVEVAIS